MYNLYEYGSIVYGNNTTKSDSDYVVVFDHNISTDHISVDQHNIDLNILSPQEFQERLYDHEISVLECFFHGASHSDYEFDFKYNKDKLRKSISTKASNSYAKFKKKLKVEKDYDPYIAKKSLWHSVRIIDFGIQIAEHGCIKDFSSVNKYYEKIMDMDDDVDTIDKEFRPLLNSLKTEFRLLCPK